MPTFYDRKTIRLPGYDYSRSGLYFVTMVTNYRKQLFGTIMDGRVVLNEYGTIIENQWKIMMKKYPSIVLDEWIIMPNHFHAIIGFAYAVGAGLPRPHESTGITLGNVVGYFKYQTTKAINMVRGSEGSKIWQRSYHERIIRNEEELRRTEEYIQNNPGQWERDEHHVL